MTEAKRAAHETIFLDHTVSRLFSADPYLSGLRRKLTAMGVLRVGQLVQMTKQELLSAAPRLSPGVLARVDRRLADVDLKLGMTTNGWHNPDEISGGPGTKPCRKKIRRAAHVASRPNSVRRSVRKPSHQP